MELVDVQRVVVGAGHNGLTAAAYLARAGLWVVVVERRDRIGSAAKLEEPWPGYVISLCAYVVGSSTPKWWRTSTAMTGACACRW